MSDTTNIMGLDILSKAGIKINGQDGTWKFKKNKNKENRLLKEPKMKEEFMELGDQIFQTVEIAKDKKLKINDKSSSTDILSMKDWHPRQWTCEENYQKLIQVDKVSSKQEAGNIFVVENRNDYETISLMKWNQGKEKSYI